LKQIFLGYVAALAIAASILTLVFFQIVSEYSTPNHGVNDVLYVWVVMAFWTLVITLLPTLILIYFSERKAWRSFWLYSSVGAVLASPVSLWFEMQIVLECAAIGAVAGLTYWAIAGRKAGLRDKPVA
jgi:hypothetical protein